MSFENFLNNKQLTDEELLGLGKKIHSSWKINQDSENYTLLSNFLSNLNIGNKSPRGFKKEYDTLKYLLDVGLTTYKSSGYFPQPVGAFITY